MTANPTANPVANLVDGSDRQTKVVLFESPAGWVLSQSNGVCRLPRVRIEDAEALTRSVARVVRRDIGVSIFVLDWLDAAGDQPVCLARLATHGPLANGFAWVAPESSGAWCPEDAAILDRSLRHQAMNDACARFPFRRFQALDELRAWYGPVLDELRMEETQIEHWQSGGDDVLLRITTNNVQTVWLKAVNQAYRNEPSISRALARMSPGDFPRVLAVNGKWNAILLEGIEGPTLNGVPRREAWLATAERLAELQQKFVGREDELLRAGCADWRWPRLVEAIPRFFEAMIPVMRSQESSRQPPLTAAELSALSGQAGRFCRLLVDLGVPDTLVHGNFSPHNVIWSTSGTRGTAALGPAPIDGKPVFLDWAFGLVAFPFLSEEYFRRRMEREHPEFSEWSADLRAAYYGPWERVLGRRSLERAKLLARAAAPLVAAVNLYFQDPEGWRSVPMRAPVLRSLVRLFAREVRPFLDRASEAAMVKHVGA